MTENMKLKVCGMKYQDNIEQVAALQPDYLGFIFYEKSTRNFTENNISKLPDSIKKTGVFVDAAMEFIIEKINTHHLQAVQLHGNESPEYCKKLKHHFEMSNDESISSKETDDFDSKKESHKDGDIEIIKAFSTDENFNFNNLQSYETVCDYYLFDAKGKLAGGNGYRFDWSLLQNYPSTKPFFLSGGIGLDEVERLLSFLHTQASKYCYAIDVNSKFEIEAGLKNIEKLKEFKDKSGLFE